MSSDFSCSSSATSEMAFLIEDMLQHGKLPPLLSPEAIPVQSRSVRQCVGFAVQRCEALARQMQKRNVHAIIVNVVCACLL
mmetsp:Transcript_22717/g.51212  ORF Transcript_22717/g.51212 Transcript_22717/m.51212 type:complete len:81 (+) Transcript_22717:739-981(+)